MSKPIKPTVRLDAGVLIFKHACEPADPRSGTAAQDVETELPIGPDHWTIEVEKPLTVGPSILCGICGIHGSMIDGKWVPA